QHIAWVGPAEIPRTDTQPGVSADHVPGCDPVVSTLRRGLPELDHPAGCPLRPGSEENKHHNGGERSQKGRLMGSEKAAPTNCQNRESDEQAGEDGSTAMS